MGADVQINKDHITIEGKPLNEMKAIDVVLSDQTDTFMTLSVILSQIDGISYIRVSFKYLVDFKGIANQRVKECDRIKATRKNLMKCGIFCKELEDGLEIHGRSIEKQKASTPYKKTVLIKTYDDHRIAMSFAILGSYFANNNHNIQLSIQNRNCVNKTFPEFWNHIEEKFGVTLRGTTEEKYYHPSNLFLIILNNKNVTCLSPFFLLA